MIQALREFKAEIFQGLAHPTRIALIDALREGEATAGTLIERLRLEQANASQHLAVLRAKRLVMGRKAGNQVFYSLRDPVIIEVLDVLKRYFDAHLSHTSQTLKEIKLAKASGRK
jgi:DNA-binding transcriptional ArsR family regulator